MKMQFPHANLKCFAKRDKTRLKCHQFGDRAKLRNKQLASNDPRSWQTTTIHHSRGRIREERVSGYIG